MRSVNDAGTSASAGVGSGSTQQDPALRVHQGGAHLRPADISGQDRSCHSANPHAPATGSILTPVAAGREPRPARIWWCSGERGKTARVEEVMTMFHDRVDAGRRLADSCAAAGLGGDGTVVLGLPRGGVPVAAEVGLALGAPLDVIVVRKLGVPSSPSWRWAPSARTASGWRTRMSSRRAPSARPTSRRSSSGSAVSSTDGPARYREGRPRLDLQGRCAVIVDDGIATGSTARAACRVARAHGASRIVLAVPVAPTATVVGAPGRVRRRALRGQSGAVLRGGRVVRRLLPDVRRRGRASCCGALSCR